MHSLHYRLHTLFTECMASSNVNQGSVQLNDRIESNCTNKPKVVLLVQWIHQVVVSISPFSGGKYLARRKNRNIFSSCKNFLSDFFAG